MKRYFIFLAALPVILWGCSPDRAEVDPGPEPSYECLLDARKASSVPSGTLKLLLSLAGYGDFGSLVQADVEAWTVDYRTQYPRGTEVAASGVFFIPKNIRSDMPLVIYTHGTIARSEAPSLCVGRVTDFTYETILGMTLASSFRCVVLMPDYIGYGSTAVLTHPYIHKESLARCSSDLVRAWREYAAAESVPTPDGYYFITGYSEGGYAAVALHERIASTAYVGIRNIKTVAGSGPYDNVAFAADLLGRTEPLADNALGSCLWALEMFKTDYGYSKPYSGIFSPSDNTLLAGINYALSYNVPLWQPVNRNPADLFRADFVRGVTGGTDTEFIGMLQANSLTSFVPQDSLIMVCGSADDWVIPGNTRNAYNAMHAAGGRVRMYEYPGLDHYTALDAYLAILRGRLSAL